MSIHLIHYDRATIMAIKNYRRSASFPIPSSKSSITATVPRINGKGSTSLPCRFHPFVSQLDEQLRSLQAWLDSETRSPAWICEGLSRLDKFHGPVLEDLIHHPRAQDILSRRRSPWVDNLLEYSLRLADAYSSFRAAVATLKQEQSATQSAIRKNDAPRVASCLRSQKKAEKDLAKMVAAVKSKTLKWASVSDTEEAGLAGILRDVMTMTANISAVLFGETAGLSAAAITSYSSSPWRAQHVVGPMVRRLASFNKKDAMEEDREVDEDSRRTGSLERLEALEECLFHVEAASDKMLRNMFRIRVFLLNLLTPSL